MIQDIQRLLDAYHAWLKDKTVLRQIDQWVEITTPYLDRHNDYIQIYAKKANGGFILTDDGYTIDDLEQSGCKLESQKRQDLLKMTLKWIDTKEVRSPDSRAYALLNDSEQTASQAVIDALQSYEVNPVQWSQRESVREELAA